MASASPRPRFTMLPAYSRAWWAVWLKRVDGGLPVAAMTVGAKRGRSWQVLAEDVTGDRYLVSVTIRSAEFERWRRWFLQKGIELPKPSRCPVVFLEAPEPPETYSEKENP